MPDPSDSTAQPPKAPEDPSSGQAPQAAGKPGNPGPPAEPLSLVPRSRAGTTSVAKENAAPAAPAGSPASFTDLMQWMKMFAAAAEAPPAEPTKPGARLQRSTLPREQRKFQRFDREPGAPDAPTAAPAQPAADAAPEDRRFDERVLPPAAAPVSPEEERTSTPASPPVPIALTGGTSGRRSKGAATRRPYPWLGMQLGVLALLGLGFFLGRATVRKTPAVAVSAAPGAPAAAASNPKLSPEAAKLIDEAMAAEQDRKFDQATELLLQVQKDFPHVRDLDFRLASLALEKNDAAKALPLLNQSINEGEQVAAAFKLRGTILNRKGGASRGMNDFESATAVDPFSAENFYFWGEALRKAGKPQAALVKLQQAMDRLREPEEEAEYRLKIRTTLIELGQENEFATELAARLAENPPPPDWLLTAAAIDLQHRNFASAAKYLERASQSMDKDLFNMRMRDYFFFSYRFEAPLKKFFDFAATARRSVAPGPTPGAADAGKAASPDAATPTAVAATPTPLPAGTP